MVVSWVKSDTEREATSASSSSNLRHHSLFLLFTSRTCLYSVKICCTWYQQRKVVLTNSCASYICIVAIAFHWLCWWTWFAPVNYHQDKNGLVTLYPYTAERKDVLGCTSLTTKRYPEAQEMSRGRSPRDISRAEGCKIPARGKSRGPRGMCFPMHPDSRQCTSILSALAGKYWFCSVFFIRNLKDLPHSALACTEWASHHPKLS